MGTAHGTDTSQPDFAAERKEGEVRAPAVGLDVLAFARSVTPLCEEFVSIF